jgi:hypothetical protein
MLCPRYGGGVRGAVGWLHSWSILGVVGLELKYVLGMRGLKKPAVHLPPPEDNFWNSPKVAMLATDRQCFMHHARGLVHWNQSSPTGLYTGTDLQNCFRL